MELADDAPVDGTGAEDSSSDTDIEISLHALTGIATPATMHLPVTLGPARLRALVDSGSTHSFVASSTDAPPWPGTGAVTRPDSRRRQR